MLAFITLILGLIGGLIIPNFFISFGFIGTMYVNLLKIMIIPILFFSVSRALMKGQNTGKITIKTISLFVVMFLTSFMITSAVVALIRPGAQFTFAAVPWEGELSAVTLSDFFLSLIPTNIITAMSNNNILPTILFAMAFGLASKKITTSTFKQFFDAIAEVFNVMLSWIMKLTPIGVFFLMGNTIATYGLEMLKAGATYIIMAWGCSILVCFLVMIVPVWIVCRLNPIEYIKKVAKVWIVSLSTCSSAGTLPTTMKVCNKEFGVPEAITNIVVPLGCTIHMCGGAVSFALLGLFCCQLYNISLTLPLFLTMILASTLINMGAPGIPGGGIVIGASYLNLLGIPIDFIGFYAGIYRLLDMIYTTMNVSGDITANVLINKSSH